MSTRVVVTGMGVVSPIGNNLWVFEENLKQGVIGDGPITRFPVENFPVQRAFEVKDFVPPTSAKRLDPFIQYAIAATNEALADAGVDLNQYDPFDIGLVMSSSKGGLTTYCNEMENFRRRRSALLAARVYSSFIPNIAAQWIARQHRIKGPAICYVTACATGTFSVSEAAEMIRRGEVKICIAGASDASVTPLALAGYHQMGVYAKGAMLPFSNARTGFQVGEGAGCLILEPLDAALQRGAKIYGEIGTHSYGSDASHIVSFDPEKKTLQKIIKRNLEREGLSLNDISYINLHGTATRDGDRYEIKELRELFGERLKQVPISATKSMTGHMLGASGAVEIIATLLGIKNSFIPPTANLRNLGEEFQGLDFVSGQAQSGSIRNALTYSMGFGGHAVSLILKRYE